MAKYTWRQIAIAAALAVAGIEGQQVFAAETQNVRAIEVPAGPLVKALDDFSRFSGQKIEFDRKSLDGRESSGVQGRYTNMDALAMLLKGAGAHAEVRDGAVWVIADDSPRQKLTTVVVTAPTTFSALRGDSSLRDIPQSVQVMSKKQLEEQNSSTLADAMNRAVGITVANVTDNMPVFAARGFRVTNVHVDSGAQMDMVSSATQPLAGVTDMGAYDRLEILRGSDALFGGGGNPGASISLIRKEPGYKNSTTIELSAGSWNRYRAEVDANAVLTEDGALRVRGDVVSLSNDYFFDNAYMRFKKAYGVLAYDVSPQTTVQFGGSFSEQNSRDAGTGLPRFPDGADANLPRSYGFIPPWAYFHKQSKEAFLKLNHEINDKWQFKANVTYVGAKADYAYMQFQDPLSPTTFAMLGKPNVTFSKDPDQNRQISGDTTITGSFDLLGRKADLMLGADYQNFDGTQKFQYVSGYPYNTGNVLTTDPSSFTDPRLNTAAMAMAITSTNHSKQRSNGFYGSVRVHVTDDLAVTLGGRRSEYAVAGTSSASLGTFVKDTSGPPSHDHTFSPFGGIVYNLSDSASVYYSYADIFFPNFGKKTGTGEVLDSVSGVNNELGIKKSWDGGKLTGTFAFYSIRQKNLALGDPSAKNPLADPNCCYYPGGLNTSRGVEAELAGKITPRWDASVGYTLNNNKATYGEVLGTFTPKHLFKLWSSYRLPEPFERFTVGGNILAQSKNYVTGTYFIGRYCTATQPHCGNGGVYTFTDVQGSYVVADLRVAYRISPSMTLAATVNNVGDTRYFSIVGAPYAGSAYGTPRNYLLKLEAKI